MKDGKCSLPEAVSAINNQKAEYDCPGGNGSNDTIQLQNDSNDESECTGGGSTWYCAIAGMPLKITKSVTILGYGTSFGGVPESAIYGNTLTGSDGALFHVVDSPKAKVSLTIKNVVLFNSLPDVPVTGVWGTGSGIGSTINVMNSEVEGWSNAGANVDGMNLNVQNSYFFGNSGGDGGGIQFTDLFGFGGNLTVSQSSFTGNFAQSSGGAISYGGAGTSSLVNSTIADNEAVVAGGGLALGSLGGSFAINGCTIAYNNCGSLNCGGGGVTAFAGDGTYTMNASIVAGNVDDPSDLHADDWNSDGSVAESNSIIQASLWGIDVNDKGGNKNGVDPFPGYSYGSVVDAEGNYIVISYGGPYYLPVVVLPSSSPAIDFLASLNLSTDERGFPHSVNTGNSNTVDIGAFEYDPNTQAETMTNAGNSASVAVVSGTGYSDGKGLELQATKVNDYVILLNPAITIQSDQYSLSAHFATGKNEGQVQVQINVNPQPACTASGPFQNVGSPVDLYAAQPGFVTVNLGTAELDSDDANCFRFLVTGKNKSSTGYAVYIDYINSVPQI